jgi:hypothetical protein
MNRMIKSMLLTSAIVVLLGLPQVTAQTTGGRTGGRNRTNQPPGGGGGTNQGNQGNRGNLDPAQMQQQMLARYKEVLEVTNDEDWKAISPLVEKVATARRDAMQNGGNRRGSGGGRGGPGSDPTGAAAELKKALDAKAASGEIKAKIAALADERQTKETALIQAQEVLRKVLTIRQEGLAILNGLLPAKKP